MVVKMVINMVNGDYCWLMVINVIIMVIVVLVNGGLWCFPLVENMWFGVALGMAYPPVIRYDSLANPRTK